MSAAMPLTSRDLVIFRVFASTTGTIEADGNRGTGAATAAATRADTRMVGGAGGGVETEELSVGFPHDVQKDFPLESDSPQFVQNSDAITAFAEEKRSWPVISSVRGIRSQPQTQSSKWQRQ